VPIRFLKTELEAALRLQQEAQQHSPQSFKSADVSSSVKESINAGASTAVWQARVNALTDELQLKTERTVGLKLREQQLEAELRSRLHQDQPLNAGHVVSAKELRDSLARNFGMNFRQYIKPRETVPAGVAGSDGSAVLKSGFVTDAEKQFAMKHSKHFEEAGRSNVQISQLDNFMRQQLERIMT